MPGLHFRWDNARRDENESVKGTFVLSITFSNCSCLGNMSVNQSRVKGNENVSPRYWRYCDYILVWFWSLTDYLFWQQNFFLARDYLKTFKSCTWLIVLTQECECLHSCVPHLVHNSSKVSSTLDENVNQALDVRTHMITSVNSQTTNNRLHTNPTHIPPPPPHTHKRDFKFKNCFFSLCGSWVSKLLYINASYIPKSASEILYLFSEHPVDFFLGQYELRPTPTSALGAKVLIFANFLIYLAIPDRTW